MEELPIIDNARGFNAKSLWKAFFDVKHLGLNYNLFPNIFLLVQCNVMVAWIGFLVSQGKPNQM